MSTLWTDEELEVFNLINRRRRQLHVHSVLYYHMHTNIITDAQFDEWAVELKTLQDKYPVQAKGGYESSMFQNWTGDTGMHLRITDWAWAEAEWLLARNQKSQ